jgi:hypothetical protein
LAQAKKLCAKVMGQTDYILLTIPKNNIKKNEENIFCGFFVAVYL